MKRIKSKYHKYHNNYALRDSVADRGAYELVREGGRWKMSKIRGHVVH